MMNATDDWSHWNPSKKHVWAYGISSKLWIGKADREPKSFGALTLIPADTRHQWMCFQYTVVGRDAQGATKRILITATGDIENTGMGWKNAAKTSVGRDWGKAPVLVEGPTAKIELPGGGKFKAWALDERGQRRAEIPVADGTLEIGPQHRTLWYEVERQ